MISNGYGRPEEKCFRIAHMVTDHEDMRCGSSIDDILGFRGVKGADNKILVCDKTEAEAIERMRAAACR